MIWCVVELLELRMVFPMSCWSYVGVYRFWCTGDCFVGRNR